MAEVLTPEQKKKFEAMLRQQSDFYGRGRTTWSAMYYGAIVLAIVLGAITALLPVIVKYIGLEDMQDTLTTVLGGASAGTTSASATAGFDKKWRAYRLSKSRIEQLRSEFIARDPTDADLETLKQIENEHNNTLIS